MKIDRLNFSYGEKIIFKDLSLNSYSKVISLMGPSGCGKTTLLHIIAGLQTPQSGSIEGLDRPCSLMFQEDRILEWADALTNVVLVLDSKKDSQAVEKASKMLEQVGIDPKMPIKKMSGGMRRRVALARALVFDAPTLLLDEPFKGLDENLTNSCAQLIKKEGKLTIVSTHSQKEAEALDATIIRIDDPDKIGIKN